MKNFWLRIVDEPDAFPPDLWQLFLWSTLATLGYNCRPVLRAHDMEGEFYRRGGCMRQWRPRSEEINQQVRAESYCSTYTEERSM